MVYRTKRELSSDGTSDWLGQGREQNASRFRAMTWDGDGIVGELFDMGLK